MLRQLVTLLVFLSVSHLGRLKQIEDDVQRMKNILVELIPFMKDIKSALNYQEANLTSFNESIRQLTAHLQEHKNQTVAEFAQLQTSLNTTQSSLDTKLKALATSLSEHQSQTEENLDQQNSTLDSLTAKVEELKANTQFLQDNLTHQLNDIQEDVTSIFGSYTCGGTGGWRRVVYLNMTNPTSTCPSGWNITGYSKRTCGRVNVGGPTCDSATFPVFGGEYKKLCGRINAYQWGSPDAFATIGTTIDGNYVEGVSLTHGSPRQHIWTFAAGVSESNPTNSYVCPCDATINITVPPFVGEDYFCESGLHETWKGRADQRTFYSNDTLWDGENCLPSSSCCSLHGPPYFIKQLPAPTTDDIEARICIDIASFVDDIAVELVELYVQ